MYTVYLGLSPLLVSIFLLLDFLYSMPRRLLHFTTHQIYRHGIGFTGLIARTSTKHLLDVYHYFLPPPPFRFLDLPPELRIEIYRYALGSSGLHFDFSRREHPILPPIPSLLRTSRQLRYETLHLYYTSRPTLTVHIPWRSDRPAFYVWLNDLCDDTRAAIAANPRTSVAMSQWDLEPEREMPWRIEKDWGDEVRNAPVRLRCIEISREEVRKWEEAIALRERSGRMAKGWLLGLMEAAASG
jgi:hypothetical protein